MKMNKKIMAIKLVFMAACSALSIGIMAIGYYFGFGPLDEFYVRFIGETYREYISWWYSDAMRAIATCCMAAIFLSAGADLIVNCIEE